MRLFWALHAFVLPRHAALLAFTCFCRDPSMRPEGALHAVVLSRRAATIGLYMLLQGDSSKGFTNLLYKIFYLVKLYDDIFFLLSNYFCCHLVEFLV